MINKLPPFTRTTWESQFCSVLFCSLAVLDQRVGHTMDTFSPFISVILIDSFTGSPVHVLTLSIHAARDNKNHKNNKQGKGCNNRDIYKK